MTPNQIEVLKQLQAAGLRGVRSGDLIDKTATRDLVRAGLADNGVRGQNPASSLSVVYISAAGREALAKNRTN